MNFFRDQRGQGLVEYVLLLIVVVAILTAAGVRLFKPAQAWVDFYLGTYTQCLLDSGQLPKIAGGNPQECDDLPGNPNGPGGSGNPNDPNDPNNPANKKDGSGGSSSSSLSDGDGRSSGSGGRGGSRGRRNFRRGGASYSTDRQDVGQGGVDSGETGQNGREKVRMVGANTSTDAFRSRFDQHRVRYVGIAGLMDEEKEKIKRKEERISKVPVESEQQGVLTQKKIPLKQTERKVAQQEKEVSGFDFGSMLRTIIIGAIIFITLIILGTQLNSISKSMDS